MLNQYLQKQGNKRESIFVKEKDCYTTPHEMISHRVSLLKTSWHQNLSFLYVIHINRYILRVNFQGFDFVLVAL